MNSNADTEDKEFEFRAIGTNRNDRSRKVLSRESGVGESECLKRLLTIDSQVQTRHALSLPTNDFLITFIA